MKIFLFIFFIYNFLPAQKFQFEKEIGNFTAANGFSISPQGFIYVADISSDEIYKLDTLGKLLKTIGGYGWDNNQFDDPVDIFTTPLRVYVSDKNNHKIKEYDKDLNLISVLFTRDSDEQNSRFGYPLGCTISSLGDMFVLDFENKRIIKFDIYKKFNLNFGGFDAGGYSLNKPLSIASAFNKIFIADEKNLLAFDFFGNGILNLELNFNLNSLKFSNDLLILTNENEIFSIDLSNSMQLSKIELCKIESLPSFKSAFIFNDKLYVLTSTKILIFGKEYFE